MKARIPAGRLLFDGKMKDLAPVGNPREAIRRKLDNPTGCAALRDLVSAGDKVLILIEDNTRNTPLKMMLPVLLDYLEGCGVASKHIELLTAPGTHRVMTSQEIVDKVGQVVVDRVKISQHDFRDKTQMVDLGVVEVGPSKIPVHVNRKALEADFVIGTGNIVPHSDAGFSGGAKIVQPGICGFATTAATHVAAALLDEIPLGVMDNPCRAGMEEVARRVGLAFIVNTVLNHRGEIVGVVAGDFVKAQREGAAIATEAYGVDVPEPADIVIVSSFPCDIDYWQAEKGLISAYFAVKKGGCIIFVTPCPEGLEHNHPRLRDWLKLGYREACCLARSTSPGDETNDLVAADLGICNSRIREKASVLLVSDGLTGEDSAVLGYTKVEDLQEAVDTALRRVPGGTIGVLPMGGVCLPVLEGVGSRTSKDNRDNRIKSAAISKESS